MIVKIFCDDTNRIYIVMIGQVLCAIGQVYMISIPSKLATTWFGPQEVSRACALAVLGTQLGEIKQIQFNLTFLNKLYFSLFSFSYF